MTVVTFALPQESGDFRRTLRAAGGSLGGAEIRVVHLGIGPAAATAGMHRLLAEEKPRMLICAGFAGGLDPRLRSGDLLVAENFSTPQLLSRAQSMTGKTRPLIGPLVTSRDPIETAAAKAALARATGALAVDMETATVAAACRAAGIPLLAVRAISDAAATPLPVPFAEWFHLDRQRPRPLALLRHLARNPRSIAPFVRFLRGLGPARRALRDFLVRYLAEPVRPPV